MFKNFSTIVFFIFNFVYFNVIHDWNMAMLKFQESSTTFSMNFMSPVFSTDCCTLGYDACASLVQESFWNWEKLLESVTHWFRNDVFKHRACFWNTRLLPSPQILQSRLWIEGIYFWNCVYPRFWAGAPKGPTTHALIHMGDFLLLLLLLLLPLRPPPSLQGSNPSLSIN